MVTPWLDAGRPLSLVALDALLIALRRDLDRPFGLSIELPDAPDSVVLIDQLRAQAKRASAP